MREPLVRLADGTVKQINPLTGTEVWTVPGRGNRPLSAPASEAREVTPEEARHLCAFCEDNYEMTPPEKSRVVRAADGTFRTIDQCPAEELHDTVAEFRRVPNLFEILSYDYWRENYGYEMPAAARMRMQRYISTPQGAAHVRRIARTKLAASGQDPELWESFSESEREALLAGFFAGGHDVIIGRRHLRDGASSTAELAGSGSLSYEEHRAYIGLTVTALEQLYAANPFARYVAVFQNWLRPAGASFDHLHKQLVAIDEYGVSQDAERERVAHAPELYTTACVEYAASHGLIIAANDAAVACAGYGHRYPTVEVYSRSRVHEPWRHSDEERDGVADLIHAIHAATGETVSVNEEWHHRPPTISTPMPWHVTIKWRVSTLAGFEGGTKIYLNTIDPWQVRERVLAGLQEHSARLAPGILVGDAVTAADRSLHYLGE